MATQYRCDAYQECDLDSCHFYPPHECSHVPFECEWLEREIRCKPVDADGAITSLESTIDSIITEELKRGTHPFGDCAKRIRDRVLELIST